VAHLTQAPSLHQHVEIPYTHPPNGIGKPKRETSGDTDTVIIGRNQSGKRLATRGRKKLYSLYNQKTRRSFSNFFLKSFARESQF